MKTQHLCHMWQGTNIWIWSLSASVWIQPKRTQWVRGNETKRLENQRGAEWSAVSPCWSTSGSSLLWPGPTRCNSRHDPLRTGFLDRRGAAPEQTPRPHDPVVRRHQRWDYSTPRNEKRQKKASSSRGDVVSFDSLCLHAHVFNRYIPWGRGRGCRSLSSTPSAWDCWPLWSPCRRGGPMLPW